MKEQTTNTRRAVATMANALHKTGLTLSEAFKKAWRRIKESMTFRASGVTFENRQAILAWFARRSTVTVTLEREPENSFDKNAIAIILHADGKRGKVGYVNRTLSESLAAVFDKGVNVKAWFRGIIGGYEGRETMGALITVSV